MGWIVGAVVVVAVVVGLLVFVAPAVFGPAFAGLAPIAIFVALVGAGAIWWRYSQRRIDPRAKADQPGATEDDEPQLSER